jgi:hypothetical protein
LFKNQFICVGETKCFVLDEEIVELYHYGVHMFESNSVRTDFLILEHQFHSVVDKYEIFDGCVI